jgi:solute carrier family 25 protein 16
MPTREAETNVRRFSAGAISGMISVFFTYPLDVIRVRMAFHTRSPQKSVPPPTFLGAFSHIYNETTASSLTLPASSKPQIASTSKFNRFPLLKFYRGFTVTITGMIPYAGVSFLSWGFLRSRLLPQHDSRPTPAADLAIGAVSGALAQTVSYPFEVVRRRMQIGGITSPDRWLRWGETVNAVWHAGGWRGFFVGLSIGYLKIVPMTAVSFAVWQGGKRVMGI